MRSAPSSSAASASPKTRSSSGFNAFSDMVSCWSVSFARRAAERDEPKQAVSSDPEAAKLGESILDRGMIDLLLQPKVSLLSGKVCGFEALARVRLNGQRVSPDQFGPAIESAHLESRFDWMVLRAAFELAARVPAHCRASAPISVNVNPSTVAEAGFGHDLSNLARASHISLSDIRIELLEKSSLDTGPRSHLAEEMREAQKHGARFSLDDFATGDSGPELLRLPVSEMKIDAYYVRGLMSSQKTKCLYWIERMVSLAKSNGLSVCAEGIEHPEQAQAMAKLGVDCGQGYLWSKPIEPQDAFDMAKERSTPAEEMDIPQRLAARRAQSARLSKPPAALLKAASPSPSPSP